VMVAPGGHRLVTGETTKPDESPRSIWRSRDDQMGFRDWRMGFESRYRWTDEVNRPDVFAALEETERQNGKKIA
jgi:hypothetical protein